MKKKMNKTGGRFLTAVVFGILLCNCITGCGATSDSVSKSDAAWTAEENYQNGSDAYGLQDDGGISMSEAVMEEDKEVVSDTAMETSAGESSMIPSAKNSNKKIIKTYDYDYETEEFDEAYAYLKEQVTKYQGYISSSRVEGTSYRTLYLTARIPAETSDEFTETIGSLGTVISQSESAEDITLQYTDIESKIVSLKTEQERLNTLLEQADNLESIIALEEKLTEIRYELENYQSRKNLYDDRVAYSTVNINLFEVNYTVAVDDSTFLSRISTGLESSFRDIKNGFVDFLVWLIVFLPYLVIWGIVLFVIIWMIRKIIKKRRKKRAMVCNPEEPSIGEEAKDISDKKKE